jgi:hypothetical protein
MSAQSPKRRPSRQRCGGNVVRFLHHVQIMLKDAPRSVALLVDALDHIERGLGKCQSLGVFFSACEDLDQNVCTRQRIGMLFSKQPLLRTKRRTHQLLGLGGFPHIRE